LRQRPKYLVSRGSTFKGEVNVFTSRTGAVKASTIRLSILLVILVVAAGVLVVDRTARSAAKSAFQQISEKLPPEEETDPAKFTAEIDQQAVRAITMKEPSATMTLGDTIVETFEWKGVRSTYSVEATYQKGPKPLLRSVRQF
jgi:hypothetical protein